MGKKETEGRAGTRDKEGRGIQGHIVHRLGDKNKVEEEEKDR